MPRSPPRPELVEGRLCTAALRQAQHGVAAMAQRRRPPRMTLAVPTSARSENVRGIVRMLAAMAVFVLNDTLIKLAAAHIPTGEAIFVRGVFTVGLCLRLIMASNLSWALPHALSPRVLVRGVRGYRRDRPVPDRADAHAARRHLRHPPVHAAGHHGRRGVVSGRQGGWRRWLATMVGLIGVLIIVRPGAQRVQPLRHPGAGLDRCSR